MSSIEATAPVSSPVRTTIESRPAGSKPSASNRISYSLSNEAVGSAGRLLTRSRQRRAAIAADRRKFLEDVVDRLDEPCALAQQAVTSAGHGVVDGARHGEDLATLFSRQPRRDQRAALQRRLDDERADGKPAQDPVAPREVVPERGDADRQVGDQRAAGLQDPAGQRLVLAGDTPRRARGRRRRSWRRPASSAPRWAAASMPSASPLVIAKPGATEVVGELRGRVAPERGRVATADDRELRL